ncbi:Transcriptional regulatory protein (LuxR-family) [uncultured Mycobacterium sp.]|uniref:Transcriptional regulatory protein (LuxR-family) n=1 Tax=uncultured Mycobacterium sp. TaxID=171292 RepID=A0A1Y5PLH9_9MYCO|nr:Transcriptional regulatory protein (LuxR-family) [uncultured Mycobacterium sp.]
MATGAPPTGVVTFLFTDVEGSTRRWEADAHQMGAALAYHDQVLRKAIEVHGGWLFKHTGDGVCAAFSSPKSAVEAAVDAQRALELPVRMGIATGEAEMRGADYFGPVLNRAARVMAAGHGGQILLADSTAALLTGVDLIDLGARRLRDLSTPVGMFQVRSVGLKAEFPPLRAFDVPLGNLRPASSSLIGRDVELEEIAAVAREHRLVTLTGAGGVGKTRLALGVATRLADEFPDGVWVIELASVTDAAAVPDAVAAVLGITQQPGKSVAESVATALEGRVRLLVLDNCEHVLDAAADLIEAIVGQSATVRILATSREGLGAADEQVWPVSSLDFGAGTDSAAVRLFADRAHSVAPRFSLRKPEEAGAVVTICRRLDGLPLAIELAASRMASMTVSELRDRLDDRFRLLVGARRSLSRHQTLRHAVAWSYDLLSDHEKLLLDRCSVFTGGFDLESACAVSESGDDYAILDRLDALVRKSLLVVDSSSGHTRYSMLETIRHFAEHQLVARGEAIEARTLHARYFAGREVDVMALWDSPRQPEAYDWFCIELPNLRTAFRWAAEQRDIDAAAAIAIYATFLGYLVNQYEPVGWAEELIEPAQAVEHGRLSRLYLMAAGCHTTGRIEEFLRYVEASRGVTNRSGYDVAAEQFAGALAMGYLVAGQPEQAVEWAQTAFARSGHTDVAAWATLISALAIAGRGDEARATAEGLMEAAEHCNPAVISIALWAHGYAFGDTDPVGALQVLRRGLLIAQNSGNSASESTLASTLSRLETQHGDPLAALDYLALAIRNYHDAGNTTAIGGPLANLASLLDRLGRSEPAAVLAGFALTTVVPGLTKIEDAIGHLREAVGDSRYESLALAGVSMNAATVAIYAFDQIDQARMQLIDTGRPET